MSKCLPLIVLVVCCTPAPYDAVDLPIGEVENDLDASAPSGDWGHALECKDIPQVEALNQPRIIISLDGLTLHLVDESVGYDRVFAVGVGKIESDEAEPSFGESLSYYPVLATNKNDFKMRGATNTACKTWWTDPETGERSPVFAGLPFMPFYGSYAVHGPIDGFPSESGGVLNRGYVSHGCVRMEAADIKELYGRVGQLDEVPVHVQREPERTAEGVRVDVAKRWIGAECQSDLDCNYAGGFCHGNAVGGRGFCSKRCTSTCPDRAHAPTTFCVADPDEDNKGMCTLQVQAKNEGCRSQDHMQPRDATRFRSNVTATVCMPASRGWIGDRCLQAADCQEGNDCTSGTCTQSCTGMCPDQPAAPWTACVSEQSLGGSACARVCTPASNASECPAGYACDGRQRLVGGSRYICVPE